MRTVEPHTILIGVLILVLATGGCDLFDSEAPSPSLSIETNRGEYHLSRDTTIEVEIRNTSGRTVYYSTCLGASLDVLEGDQVVNTIGLPVCYCACPAKLESGEKVASTVSNVYIETLAEESDQLRGDPSTSYRLTYAFYQDEGRDMLLPRQELRSNQFTLRLPQE